ncbi:MAG: cell division protein FtsL [Bacillota bacterium]|jgi:cell division protein FtsL|nr:cell division protein FtsL [Bacillota bacterium]
MIVANNAYARSSVVYPYPDSRPQNRPKGRIRRRPLNLRRWRRIAAGILVVFLALVVVYRYGQLSQINIQLNQQTKTRDALLDEQRHLKITISELTALGRLEKLALEELGMKYPTPDQIRYVGGTNPESGDGDGN